MTSYVDDFNRADSTTVTGWIESGDDWSIKSNMLAPGISSLGIITYNSPLTSDDHYCQAVISVATSSSMGVYCRADGTSFNSGYLWRNNGSSWNLFYNVGGSFTSIASYAAGASNGDVAKIQAVGSTITAYVNGIQRASVTNTEVSSGKYVGIRCEASSTCRFDNFAAADVGSIVLPKRYSGSAWIDIPQTKIYVGSSWQNSPQVTVQ